MNQLNTKKFKMETPTTIIQLTRPNVCMAKLDIKMLTTASQLTHHIKSFRNVNINLDLLNLWSFQMENSQNYQSHPCHY